MPPAIRLIHRSQKAAVVGVSLATFGLGACVTAPPPDLPELPKRGPRIVQDAVQPPANEYLTALPVDDTFIVPVEVTDPTQPIVGRAFVDFYPGSNNLALATGFTGSNPTQPALDGGVTSVVLILPPSQLGDLGGCHIIQFFVANSFSGNSAHTPGDSLGADSVTWFYAPMGPNGCVEFDAGDAAADSPLDVNLVTPDAVRPP